MSRPPLGPGPTGLPAALLGRSGPDPGCDAAFEVLDGYVEALAWGGAAEERYPEVAAHLRNCAACAEDADGLLAALRKA